MSESKFHYLRGFVAVRKPDLDQAINVIPVAPVDPGTVLESASEPATEDSFLEARTTIDEVLGFLPHDDPAVGVSELADQGVEGTVIHVVGLANHWSFSPGTKPEPIPGILPDVPNAEEGSFVGVVDSGIVPYGPWWFTDNIAYEHSDIETIGGSGPAASHGTFVAGLIRQLACTHAVSMARLRLVDHERVAAPNGNLPGVDLSTELHLFEAIIRLLQRHRVPPAALNLSLGTYTENDLSSLIMTDAIRFWDEHSGNSPVFAAGGNEYEQPGYPYSPFWPAALEGVIGVGAADPYGTEVVWDYHTPTADGHSKEDAPTGTNRRDWIDRTAPGTDLINLGGGAAGGSGLPQLVRWSGSSFAAPVALAMQLRGVTTDTVHANVEGLSHAVDAAAEQTPWPDSPCSKPTAPAEVSA